MQRISFLIVDPSYIIRKGLRVIIENLNNAYLHESESDISAFFKMVNELEPNIVLINPALIKDLNDFRINIYKLEKKPILIKLTQNKKTEINAPFFDYININDEKSEILNKIETIINKTGKEEINTESKSILSEREKNVLKLVASGYTNKEIAEKLYISTHTVITHRKNITQKLDIKTISGLTVYAVINKLIDIKDLR
ncbi:MAG: helix-turn-helix transcriptional regulator [Bacteroidales bacterium]|nr:helix-turn-helix transcriptional regulator [Bacteroidales bacterium]